MAPKRKIEVIDLTGDNIDDGEPQYKASKARSLPQSFQNATSARIPDRKKSTSSSRNSGSSLGVPHTSWQSRSPRYSQGHAELPTPPSSSQPMHSAPYNSHRLPSASQSLPSSQPGSLTPSSQQPAPRGGRMLDKTPVLSRQTHSRQEWDSWPTTLDHEGEIYRLSTLDQEGEIYREIDLTEDFDDDVYENYELYGILNTKIVGCRFYDGRATVGEYVRVKREPSNPYDKNAIRIDNVMRDPIGHIGRQVAAKLAPLIDSGSLLVEGALTGPKTFYDCPIGLKLFGTSDPVASAALVQQMKDLRLPVNELTRNQVERKRREALALREKKAREKTAAAMRKNGNMVFDDDDSGKYSNLSLSGDIGVSTGPSLDELLENTASYNPRDVQDLADKLGAGEEVLAKMPMAEQPQMLSTSLLPYQRQGLKWMLDQESPCLPKSAGSDQVVQLWKRSGKFFTNIATNYTFSKEPELASGGILADDMGLGKTIQIISLVMADPKKDGRPTLIVAPLSVMSNWSGQAGMHVKKKYTPRVLVYHGQGKTGQTAGQLKEYDIVITTYQTMTQELFPASSKVPMKTPTPKGLFSLNWRRIVLDEGHQIRNPKAKMSLAACSVRADSRWVLSGTPIVNSLKDLYSHVKFLGLSGGLTDFEIFNSTLIRPLKSGDPGARLLLQALMSTLCLRRMKDMKFVDLKLPEITFHKYPVKFLPHEQERYDAFKSEAKGLLAEAKVKKGDRTMTHLLEVLLRLRQTCNHWKMCGEDRVNRLMELVDKNSTVDVMDPANRQALQDLLQLRIDGQEDCPICIDSMNEPVITACAHTFCRACIEKVIEVQHKCPYCRARLEDRTVLVEPAAGFGEGDDALEIDPDETSSKIEALVKMLKASETDPNVKTVVFSQWTSFLDLAQAQLEKHKLPFTRLDGKMNALRRDVAIESLNTDASCKIMLASLSVCSVGLNLVAANQVVLADSWWAPAIEDQAVDRIHRLGQTRACKVVRLVVEGTIEDDVLEIQAKKRKLASEAFGEKEGSKRKETRASTLADIARLLS